MEAVEFGQPSMLLQFFEAVFFIIVGCSRGPKRPSCHRGQGAVSSSRNRTSKEQGLGSGSGPWGRIWPSSSARGALGPSGAGAKADPVPGGRGQALPAAASWNPGTKIASDHPREPHGVQDTLPRRRLPRPTANPPTRGGAKPHGHAAPPSIGAAPGKRELSERGPHGAGESPATGRGRPT